MPREHKLALVVGFTLILFVGFVPAPGSIGVLIAIALGCYFATMAAHRRIPGT